MSDDDGVLRPLTIHPPMILISHPVWQRWLSIGASHLLNGRRARDVEDQIAELECGLVTSTAAAFALDGFTAGIAELAGISSETLDAWIRNRTRVEARVVETLKHAVAGSLDSDRIARIEELFLDRHFVVHPREEARATTYHEAYETNTAEEFTRYRLEASRDRLGLSLSCIEDVLADPRTAELRDYMQQRADRISELRRRYEEALHGPLA